MRHAPIDPKLFTENRARLRAQLLPNSLAVVNANDILPTNADGTMGLRPNSDLYYLTGIEQEQTILLLAPEASDEKLREVLFLREAPEDLKIWEGHKLSREEASQISGIAHVKWLSEFRTLFHQLMCEVDHVYLNSNEHKRAVVDVESRDARFIRDCQARYPLHDYQRLARVLGPLRLVKSDGEINLIRQASGITRRAFLRALKKVRPGIAESDLEAEFAHEFIRSRAQFAYPPIIACGANSCVLHYVENDQTCRSGDLLLLDVGASYANYNSDLTRTVPVSGRFTRRQKQVYHAVLRVQRAMMQAAVPGVVYRDWQKQAEKLIEEELLKLGLLKQKDIRKQSPERPALKRYFMHGIGHPLGLDVHDVGPTHQPFQPGWVMTVEPGIYIPEEGFGVRLENNVLITDKGAVDLMADIPIEADAIESLMAR